MRIFHSAINYIRGTLPSESAPPAPVTTQSLTRNAALASEMPDGWMTQDELDILYRLGLQGESIIEIGSWIGRSTCAIASGIRDRVAKPTRFDVIDHGITGERDWYRRFDASLSLDPKFEAVRVPGGIGGQLMQNLADRDLLKFVTLVILGDIRDYTPFIKYNTAFLDVLHDDNEIEMNMPIIKNLLEDKYIFLADDVIDEIHASKIAYHLGSVSWMLSRPNKKYSKLGLFWTKDFEDRANYIMHGD